MNWLPVLGLAFGLAAPATKEAPKKADAPAIVGEWECVQLIAGGQMFPEEDRKTISFEFTAEGQMKGRFGSELSEGKYTVNSAKDPAELEFKNDKTDTKKQGIYKIEKDMLILCFAEGTGAVPTKFESPVGTRIMLMTFRRAEKKKE